METKEDEEKKELRNILGHKKNQTEGAKLKRNGYRRQRKEEHDNALVAHYTNNCEHCDIPASDLFLLSSYNGSSLCDLERETEMSSEMPHCGGHFKEAPWWNEDFWRIPTKPKEEE